VPSPKPKKHRLQSVVEISITKVQEIMMTNNEMIKFVDAVKAFNRKQLETEPINEMLYKVDQDPWRDCRAEFTPHCNKLDKDSMYKTNAYPTTLDVDEV
jgi:hypothetical protein